MKDVASGSSSAPATDSSTAASDCWYWLTSFSGKKRKPTVVCKLVAPANGDEPDTSDASTERSIAVVSPFKMRTSDVSIGELIVRGKNGRESSFPK
eukprot:CAMPEP_0202101432 /NCGR_PEP_ID=MMETSP0965-20130614/3729_1 /ASSEMBLY_ACC=CAM_ASM_000507 /TAXON_ID=4773 /ORGANISM="Schizochytrium aggregatum, Strain ATCC28209" /LENGTH=95 /DNA_ID=CAMNT_0048670145 /DNA_START=126 /DNA_END=413 /DNA_ORIENTATION=+